MVDKIQPYMNSVNRVLIEGMNATLAQPYTKEEVCLLFSFKSSRPRWYVSFFLSKVLAYCWVRCYLCRALLFTFRGDASIK